MFSRCNWISLKEPVCEPVVNNPCCRLAKGGIEERPKRVQTSTMIVDERHELVNKYISAYNSFDLEGMLAVIHPNVVFENISGGHITARAVGISELRALAIQSQALFTSQRQVITNLSLDRDRAEARILFEGTFAADLPSGSKAGETLRLQGRTEFAFKDGKNQYYQGYKLMLPSSIGRLRTRRGASRSPRVSSAHHSHRWPAE